MGFPSFLLIRSLSLRLSSFVFRSFTLKGHDIGRSESLLALLSLSACGGNLIVNHNFLLGL